MIRKKKDITKGRFHELIITLSPKANNYVVLFILSLNLF